MAIEMATSSVLKLSCSVQNYGWGKVGRDSKVAQLKVSSDEEFTIVDDKPYAELWMGVHPKAPSVIASPPELKGISLEEWIKSNKWALGEHVERKFNGQLPFLFKVLSINKALSIQAHPNKSTAMELHSCQPDIYRDPNHKPEMVIALTHFKGLCGFRPFKEISKYITTIPELKKLMSTSAISGISNGCTEGVIKQCFKDLMHQKDEVVSENLSKLVSRVREGCDILSKDESQLLLQLHSWFPNDVGCFCMFFMNVVYLSPGQAMFLGPNIPHAYISGDVVECMANSDNVVRAGLTPKFKDKDTLCNMLVYQPRTSDQQLFTPKPHPVLSESTLYDPPVDEFTIAQIKLNKVADIPAINGPSIILVVKGSGDINITGSDEGVSCSVGEVMFIPAMNGITITPNSAPIILYRAFCEL